jgi:hypothetical protein
MNYEMDDAIAGADLRSHQRLPAPDWVLLVEGPTSERSDPRPIEQLQSLSSATSEPGAWSGATPESRNGGQL